MTAIGGLMLLAGCGGISPAMTDNAVCDGLRDNIEAVNRTALEHEQDTPTDLLVDVADLIDLYYVAC